MVKPVLLQKFGYLARLNFRLRSGRTRYPFMPHCLATAPFAHGRDQAYRSSCLIPNHEPSKVSLGRTGDVRKALRGTFGSSSRATMRIKRAPVRSRSTVLFGSFGSCISASNSPINAGFLSRFGMKKYWFLSGSVGSVSGRSMHRAAMRRRWASWRPPTLSLMID